MTEHNAKLKALLTKHGYDFTSHTSLNRFAVTVLECLAREIEEKTSPLADVFAVEWVDDDHIRLTPVHEHEPTTSAARLATSDGPITGLAPGLDPNSHCENCGHPVDLHLIEARSGRWTYACPRCKCPKTWETRDAEESGNMLDATFDHACGRTFTREPDTEGKTSAAKLRAGDRPNGELDMQALIDEKRMDAAEGKVTKAMGKAAGEVSSSGRPLTCFDCDREIPTGFIHQAADNSILKPGEPVCRQCYNHRRDRS